MAQRRLLLPLLWSVILGAFAWYCATHAVDFPIYHRAGAQVLRGDFELYPQELYRGEPAPGHGFRYAPAIAFLFVPLAILPLAPAALVFFVLKLAAVAYTLHRVRERLRRGTAARLIAGVLLVAGGYLVEEFRYGNFHLFAVALVVLALDRADRGEAALPGAALAVAIATKLTPLLVLPYWIVKRRFAACAATLTGLAVLWALPMVLVGPAMNDRLTVAFARYAVEKVDENDNFSIRGVLVRYLTQRPPDPRYPDASLVALPEQLVTIVWLVLVTIAAAATMRAMLRPTQDPRMAPVEWSLLLLGMLLASPHSQRPYFSMTFVPVAVLLSLYPGPFRRWPRAVQAALVVAAAAGTVLPLMMLTRRAALTYQMGSPYFFGALGLALVLVRIRVTADGASEVPGARAEAVS